MNNFTDPAVMPEVERSGNPMKKLLSVLVALCLLLPLCASADQLVYDEEYPKGSVIGDALAGSPELAPRGDYAIGVRTIEIVHKDQVDLKNITDANPRPLYDRKLTVEVWYPAVAAEGARQLSFYTDYIGEVDEDFIEPFDFPGRAMRDAEPYAADGPYPVLIITHGYPGSRYLLSNLGENLSTKGYVVFSIAHTDNTYTDFDPSISFASAMINRSADQRFMVTMLDELNTDGFLAGLMNTDKVGMMGYSFGGYGLLRTLGIKLNEGTLEWLSAYRDLLTDPEEYKGDKRVKAAVLFAPYGQSMFDMDTLTNIDVPTLWLQGNEDTTVPYSTTRPMFEGAVNSDRYMLTYDYMHHKVAPNPSPIAAQKYSFADGARRWDDWVWNQWHVNGINAHFITAFMDAHLKGETEKLDYLNVKEPVGRNCVYKLDENGNPTEEHTYWPGFDPNNTTLGLFLDHLGIGE